MMGSRFVFLGGVGWLVESFDCRFNKKDGGTDRGGREEGGSFDLDLEAGKCRNLMQETNRISVIHPTFSHSANGQP